MKTEKQLLDLIKVCEDARISGRGGRGKPCPLTGEIECCSECNCMLLADWFLSDEKGEGKEE